MHLMQGWLFFLSNFWFFGFLWFLDSKCHLNELTSSTCLDPCAAPPPPYAAGAMRIRLTYVAARHIIFSSGGARQIRRRAGFF
jgi:hypothetical protein